MALVSSTVSINGTPVLHHVATVPNPRGVVGYLDGDGMAMVTPPISQSLQDMANAANAAGFTFVAPKSPLKTSTGVYQWWEAAGTEDLARAYIDFAASTYAPGKPVYTIGYSGGGTALCKSLLKIGSWPAQYSGASLIIGSGSTTNSFSTPTAWRGTWPVHYVVGSADVAGATVPTWWSANDAARSSEAQFRANGHPTKFTETTDNHKTYAFGTHVANFLKLVAPAPATPTSPAPAPSATTILSKSLANAATIVWAASVTGVPLHIAAALFWQESKGLNIYGHDAGGFYSTRSGPVTIDGVIYPQGSNVPVTRANYLAALDMLRAGAKSNGVGPGQATYGPSLLQAEADGIDLSDPPQNMRWALDLLASYLQADYSQASVELSATRYNRGPRETVVNQYGRDVWAKSEEYRLALLGADTTAPAPDPGTPSTPPPATDTTAPTGVVLVEPSSPLRVVTVDPGSTPVLAPVVPEVVNLPDPAPGPVVVTDTVYAPTASVVFRGEVVAATHFEEDRELAIAGPDQAPAGAGLVRATGKVTMVRPLEVVKRGWNPLLHDVPVTGEPIIVNASMDGGWTERRRFTGTVAKTYGSPDDLVVTVDIEDRTKALGVKFSHDAVSARHPSPDNGQQYMAPGMHSIYVTNAVARQARFYATSPADGDAVMLSAPLMGSTWPEVGQLFLSQTLKEKTATSGIAADAPDNVRTPWGIAVSNVWAKYRPRFRGTVTGKMDRPLGVRMCVAPTRDDWCFFEAWWGIDSFMVLIAADTVRVELQRGWNTAGGRNIVAQRNHTITPEQAAAGFDLDVWFSPNGSLSVIVDGAEHVMDPFPTLPTSMLTKPMDEIRITSRPEATQMGGLVVVSSADRGVLPEWERTFHADVDVDDQLWGIPAMVDRNGLDLLTEQAEAELSTMWVDEWGHLQYVGRRRMDARPSKRTLTETDIESTGWAVSPDSVVSHVNVTWIQPRMAHNRFASGQTQHAWEGSRETLQPGEKREAVITTPDDEDWVGVDGPFSNVGPTTVGSVNTGDGSWLGGTLVDKDSSAQEVAAPVAWYRAEARQIDRRTWSYQVSYTPPAGVTQAMETTTAEIAGLRKIYQGRGPVLRARGVQQWIKASIPSPVPTGAVLDFPVTLEHDAGFWVQTQKQARSIAARLAVSLAQPIPAWKDVSPTVPDLDALLGDTQTLRLPGGSAPQRLAGIHLTIDAESGAEQSLNYRQLRP